MGLSVSVASAIIAVSVIIVIEISLGNLLPVLTDLNESYESFKDRAVDKTQSDINIDSISTTPNGSGYDLNITIENTGSVVIDTNYCNVLVNGTFYPFYSSKDQLYPKKSAYFTIENLPGSGQFRLKVVSNLGISDYETFVVT